MVRSAVKRMEAGIRLMQPGDLPAVMGIQLQAYGAGYQESREVLGAKLALAPQGCWLAEYDGRAVAYVFSHPWHDSAPPPLHVPLEQIPSPSHCVFLHDLAVVPEVRSGGIAARLFQRVVDWASDQAMSRIALVALDSAVGYWQRQGFIPVKSSQPSVLDGMSGYGGGALFMQRMIESRSA